MVQVWRLMRAMMITMIINVLLPVLNNLSLLLSVRMVFSGVRLIVIVLIEQLRLRSLT